MNASYYDLLGVSKNADENEIKKSYKKLCLQHHPDKGGKPEQFQKIQKAYEVLSDSQKRSIYDQTGQDPDVIEQGRPSSGFGGMGPVDIGDIFMNMFGQGMGSGFSFGPGQGRKRKGPLKSHEISVSLYDFYHGKTIKLQFDQQKFCQTCKGEGCKTTVTCQGCGGKGFVEQMMMIGPGMAAVNRSPCGHCRGTCKQNSGTCVSCNGKKFFKKEKVLNVTIEPGMTPGDSLTFPNECSDDIQYEESGDVRIIFQEADSDSQIRRYGNDLHATHTISFTDSLLGTTYITTEHPGHKDSFSIEVPKGVLNGETIVVTNEGMPKRNTKQFGTFNLKIQIVINDFEKSVLKDKEELIKNMFMNGD